jgi:transcription termination factor Rho
MSDEQPPEKTPVKAKKKAAAKKAPTKKAAVAPVVKVEVEEAKASTAKAAPKKKAAAKKVADKKPAPVVEAPPAVPAKKAAAKKSPTKKKATAPEPEAVVEQPPVVPTEVDSSAVKPSARKSGLKKKAAEMLAQMQSGLTGIATPVASNEAATSASAEIVVQPEQTPEPPPPAAEPTAAADEAPAEADPATSPEIADQENQPQERRKSKFERWKERRERFRQEKIARRLALEGKGPPPSNDRQPASQPNFQEDERPRIPEVPLGPPEPAEGVLELTPKGYGFLRRRELAYAQHPLDAFISAEFIRQYGLREGMHVKGISQKGARGPQITSVEEVNARAPEAMRDMPLFEELKAINPNKKIQLETRKDRFTTRVIDMFTPVGRGQRGLIVAPPRAGKTTLLQHIAEAVVENHPNMHLMILLVDERPEEVTEFKRILPKAEIYASSNDQDVKSHTRIAAFAVERAKRLVECGDHVFMLMDSITRLARAFNNAKQGGATMSGGMGVGAMEIPRRLFAAARNTRGAGSLTVLATALIETGSRMDDLIFQEFKGTGNMELVLDRKIAEQFYYPAVNIFKSGTRREELLLQPFQLDKIHMLRRGLAGHKPIDAIQRVLTLMERYPSNAQMLVDLPNKG